ncbi:MAG: cytochrome c5 family protein [Gammaproteobacteria bacterium]|nr:cytochrome c5 family protein [Gammaproteobacteria bacterium]MBK82162.1 cytochrome c5 family protein [Gammaproteobacteria bacterium]
MAPGQSRPRTGSGPQYWRVNVVKSAKFLLGLVMVSWAAAAAADRVPPGTDDEIRERLEPFGELCRAGDDCGGGAAGAAMASSGGAMSGEQVYNQFCGTCHNIGVAGAPKLGDVPAWEPRVAKGMDTLWDHTLNGFNAMPAKGTCMGCSDDELRAALDYIVDQAQ